MTCNTFKHIDASEPYFCALFNGNIRKSVTGDILFPTSNQRLTRFLNKLWNEAVLNKYNLLPWSLCLLTYCSCSINTKAGKKATILSQLEK